VKVIARENPFLGASRQRERKKWGTVFVCLGGVFHFTKKEGERQRVHCV